MFFDGQLLNKVRGVKIAFDVLVDEHLRWDEQTNNISKNVSKGINLACCVV